MVLQQTPQLFRPLTRRPSATTVTIRELLHKVHQGEVRIPRFQRPLRWTRADVIQLLDSVWRGYPIGSLLFWKRKAEADRVVIGGAQLEAPAVTDAWWVVDGQQRITALAATLLALDHSGDERWVAHFNPEREEFRSGPPPPDRVGLDVPMSDLGDLRRLGKWIRGCALNDDAIATVEETQQRLLDYAVPAYIVETDDEQALRGVFARLNCTGARMRADEVFQALLGDPIPGGQPSLDLDVLQSRCDLDDFGLPARADVLKAVLAMSGMDPTRRLEDVGSLGDLSLVGPEDAADALTRTVSFLVHECAIPHVSLVPYPVVFVILSRWFHIHPNSHPATRIMLSRWVWRGAFTSAHQRAEVSKMREQVKVIQGGDAQKSLDRLLDRIGITGSDSWQLDTFNLKSAHSRVEVLALLSKHPRDPLGPIRIKELIDQGRVAREIFPARHWAGLPDSSKRLTHTLANRMLLGGIHTGLYSKLRSWTWAEHRQALESHLIDATAFELLKRHDVSGFLEYRASRLTSEVQSFLDGRAAWNQPVLRPLEAYEEAVDGA